MHKNYSMAPEKNISWIALTKHEYKEILKKDQKRRKNIWDHWKIEKYIY